MSADLPIGTPITYWPGFREGPGIPSFTRSNAWPLGGTPVVLVHGQAGGIALTHIERRVIAPIGPARPEAEVKAEVIRDLASAQRLIARNSATRDGRFEAEGFADWLDERANLIDPRRLEGAHP